MSRESHPVWAVYDKLRTARLNVKYYSRRLQFFERLNFWFELVLLASAPSSAVAGLWFWNKPAGELVWQYFGVVAAIVALTKPLLMLPKKIKEFESILSGYRVLEYDLMEIKVLVEQSQKYDASLQSEFKKAMSREKALIGKTPETRENTQIKNLCEFEVLKELPAESFFVPEESS